MSRVNFFGPKSEYDEEQSRERYLQYLKVASQNSALKESAEFETEPPAVREKPITEILSDEAEISRVLQEYLNKLLIPADARKKNVNETDDDYDQRINPIQYVMSRLYPDEKKLILTNFQQLLADTQNIKMLPRAFLDYIDNYKRLYQETGGVKGFPNTSAIIAEIRALKHVLPDTKQLQRSINNLRGSQAMFKRDISAQLNNSINDIINRLQNFENLVGNIDYDRIQQTVNNGVQDGIQGTRIIADNVYAGLVNRLEQLPTRQEIDRVNGIITRQVEQIAENVRQGRIRSQADKIEILQQLDQAFTQIDAVLMDKVNSTELTEINNLLQDVYGLSRELQQTSEEFIRMTREETGNRQFTDIMNSLLLTAVDRGEDINNPLVIERARREALNVINRQSGGRGLNTRASFIKKKQHPKMSLIKGRGIHVDTEPKFVEFGKYALQADKLNQGKLNVKTLKGNGVKDFNNIQISDDFCDVLNELIDTQKINEKQVHRLPASEKRIFAKLINGSGLYGRYKIKLVPSEEEKNEIERFEMVKGIYSAGNDSKEVVDELKHFIIKFINDGRLPRKQGLDTLYELNCVRP